MSAPDDPLFRAVVAGDSACPDGAALARLGDLVRSQARPPEAVDLVARVREALDADESDTQDDETAVDEDLLIDAYYDADERGSAAAALPELARLRGMVRRAATPEHEPDLLPRVQRSLARESARQTQGRVAPTTRWRIWTAVIGGHVAAMLALAVTGIHAPPVRSPENRSHYVHQRPLLFRIDVRRMQDQARAHGAISVPELPERWSALRQRPADLFALRRSAPMRAYARRFFLMKGSSGTVQASLAWLRNRQDVATGAIGPLTGDPAHDCTVQSLAALALLGEGVDDQGRAASARRALDWITAHCRQLRAGDDLTVDGVVALALVEGAVLLDEADLHRGAAAFLARLQPDLVRHARSAGKEGFLLLAVETARLNGISVPPALRSAVQHRLARSLPRASGDVGQQGLAAFARQVNGVHRSRSTAAQLARIATSLPRADELQRCDPLAWFFASLAMRELGGEEWAAWSESLQRSLLVCFRYSADGQAWLPGERVPYAAALGPAADVYATALAVLDLQVAYRYLPLAP